MFSANLYAELVKLRRSSVTWILVLAFGFGPLVAMMFMIIIANPEIGRRLGLIAAKAHMAAAAADWSSYLSMISQMLGIGGVIIVGMIGTYVFGREYTEGTAKNLLTLPMRRSSMVAAKFTACALWYLLIVAWVLAETFLFGSLIKLPGFSPELAATMLLRGARLFVEALLLVTASAWVAVATKGVFGPLGFTIGMLVLGTALGATGWGPWFPWAIVPLDSGMAGPDVPLPGMGAKVVLLCTAAAGWLLTLRTLERSDNLQ